MQQCEHWSKVHRRRDYPWCNTRTRGLWGRERCENDHRSPGTGTGKQATRNEQIKSSWWENTTEEPKTRRGFGGRDFWRWNAGAAPFLLLQGEFQSVAEDLDSLLLITGSVCRGRLTVEAEHLPAERNTESRAFILTPWATAGGSAILVLPQEGGKRESWRRRVTLTSTCDHVGWSYI